MKKTLSQQGAATDIAAQFFRSGLPPKAPREAEREMIESGLKAASRALWLLPPVIN